MAERNPYNILFVVIALDHASDLYRASGRVNARTSAPVGF